MSIFGAAFDVCTDRWVTFNDVAYLFIGARYRGRTLEAHRENTQRAIRRDNIFTICRARDLSPKDPSKEYSISARSTCDNSRAFIGSGRSLLWRTDGACLRHNAPDFPRASRSCCWNCCSPRRARLSSWRPIGHAPPERTRLPRIGICLCLARSYRRSDKHSPFASGN